MVTKFMSSMFAPEGIKQIKQEIYMMDNVKKQYQEFTNKISKIGILTDVLDMKKLPNDIDISTMTLTCSIGTTFNVMNIAKYIDLSYNFIETVKYGAGGIINRTLDAKKISTWNKKNKKTKKNFYNQVSLLVKIKNFIKINVKLFINGSIQMTGCKSIKGALWVLHQLFEKLKTSKYILNETRTQIVPCSFVGDATKLEIEQLKSFKIAMINSGFNIGFKINREQLFNILTTEGYNCVYDPTKHACVNIKYNVNTDKVISIFVFDSGSIIITGANTGQHIISGYNFINVYLITNYKKIVKRDISLQTIQISTMKKK